MSTKQTHGEAEMTANGNSVVPADPDAEDGSKIPDFYNSKIFENILKENVIGYKKILNFKAFPALAAGENYAGTMLRTEIDVELQDGKTKSLSYMCKIPIDSPFMNDIMERHNFFDIETLMYHEVVPEFEKLYQDAGVEVKFGAQFHKLPIEKDHICLEDLRPRGFKNVNRLEGLDMDHIHCVLKKLAQWHAASAVRVSTKGQYAEILVNGIYQEDETSMLKQYNDAILKLFRKCLPTYKDHQQYLANVEHLIDKFNDVLFKAAEVDPTEFNVLNHGDLWCNNIMFQYDASGKINETYFVDYQIPKYGTPAQDLFLLLLSSAKLELKLKYFDYFIKFYHENLIENLKLLKYSKPLPTLKDIHTMLYKYGIFGFYPITFDMASVLLDPIENANLDNIFGESSDASDFKMLMFSNPRYRKHVEVILPWLNNRGALEC